MCCNRGRQQFWELIWKCYDLLILAPLSDSCQKSKCRPFEQEHSQWKHRISVYNGMLQLCVESESWQKEKVYVCREMKPKDGSSKRNCSCPFTSKLYTTQGLLPSCLHVHSRHFKHIILRMRMQLSSRGFAQYPYCYGLHLWCNNVGRRKEKKEMEGK